MNLSPDLERWRREIEGYAREYGLDFYDVVFEVLDYDQMNEVAAYGGFPTRYPHWRFGMEYEELAKSYSYGLSKIYEMVINNNPVYAYLMKANAPVEQKLVMAHVFGHADFFKNNFWFSKTNRRMIDEMANHATRVRSHIDRHGLETVEDFIDACLCLENLIDSHADVHRAAGPDASGRRTRPTEDEDGREVPRLPSKELHGAVHQPAGVPGGAEGAAWRSARKRKRQRARGAAARRAAVPARARAARELGARHPRHRPRRGLLLRAAGHDQDHERGLGQLLALHDHDPARAHRRRGDRLRRPALGHAGHDARAGSTPTRSASSCSATSRTAGTRGKFGKE